MDDENIEMARAGARIQAQFAESDAQVAEQRRRAIGLQTERNALNSELRSIAMAPGTIAGYERIAEIATRLAEIQGLLARVGQ